jgi:hypothetical protein
VTAPSERFEDRWLEASAADREFRLITRWTAMALRLESGDHGRTYRIEHSVMSVEPGQTPGPALVTLRGSDQAWSDFLAPVPAAPNHHILAMQRRRTDFTIDGRHVLLQNLRTVNRAMELLQAVARDTDRSVA